MKRPVDYVTDDEQIAVVANRENESGIISYLTVYSSKARTNKIFVAMNKDGAPSTEQLEDFIQILQQMSKEFKAENKLQ